MRPSYVYILASGLGGTLYTGATIDLIGRVSQHGVGAVEGFTKKHKVDRLVYYETFDNLDAALLRERQMKKWKRSWKIRLIEERNPDWADLYRGIAKP